MRFLSRSLEKNRILYYHDRYKLWKTIEEIGDPMLKFITKLLFLSLTLIFTFTLFRPSFAQADWPPFMLYITPHHQDGLITYKIRVQKNVDWPFADLNFKIPLPAGTRFVESSAPPDSSTSFDGAEITFFTTTLHRAAIDYVFTVEVTDTTQTVFGSHAWISWAGEIPGTYLTDPFSVDTTRLPLNWNYPPPPRLQLDAMAMVDNRIVTYELYFQNVGYVRMWDLKVSLPLPEGTKLLKIEAPPEFTTLHEGNRVFFNIIEMPRLATYSPFRVKVAIPETITSPLVTQAEAYWKNAGRQVGWLVPEEETTVTGKIIVQPDRTAHILADYAQDVPLPSYDLTSVALSEQAETIEVTLYPMEPIPPVGEPLTFMFDMDTDCNRATGQVRGVRGNEYKVSYVHETGRAWFVSWVAEEQKWNWQGGLPVKAVIAPDSLSLTLSVPKKLLPASQQFCWQTVIFNTSQAYQTQLPGELVPSRVTSDLGRFQIMTPIISQPQVDQ